MAAMMPHLHSFYVHPTFIGHLGLYCAHHVVHPGSGSRSLLLSSLDHCQWFLDCLGTRSVDLRHRFQDSGKATL